MAKRDRHTHEGLPARRGRVARDRALAGLVTALALAASVPSTAAASGNPNIPGYNPAAIDRAIAQVGQTSAAVNRALHPGGHPRRHRHRHAHKHA